MEIQLAHIGKRYNREWIFNGLDASFPNGTKCAILGGNGSGKSTLLQILSGYLTANGGKISWKNEGKEIAVDQLFPFVSLCTPVLSLYDEFTLTENAEFFLRFKSFRDKISAGEFAAIIGLEKQSKKQLKFFSSGMRQRVKLGLAILADTPLLLLDEPTSHLDANAIQWYKDLLNSHSPGRSIFVASNSHEDEIFLCKEKLMIEAFK